MTPELLYLVWSAALTLLLAVIGVSGATLQVGLPTLAGNREGLPEMTGWAGRAQRAHRNMLESLVLFAILVLAAKAVGISNAMTLLGAQLFFWGRLGAHGGVGRVDCRADPDLLAAGEVEGSDPSPPTLRSSDRSSRGV
jgi:uncharacterized MAPEG superfamily protein